MNWFKKLFSRKEKEVDPKFRSRNTQLNSKDKLFNPVTHKIYVGNNIIRDNAYSPPTDETLLNASRILGELDSESYIHEDVRMLETEEVTIMSPVYSPPVQDSIPSEETTSYQSTSDSYSSGFDSYSSSFDSSSDSGGDCGGGD